MTDIVRLMTTAEIPLGARLRELRRARRLSVRKVAAAVDLDASLLSRIESGRRLPSVEQTAALAAFYEVPEQELQAARIVDKFWKEHADDPAAPRAACLIYETAPAYRYRVSNSVNKRGIGL